MPRGGWIFAVFLCQSERIAVASTKRQDFADGCFQPRARRASQSFDRVALAESLTRCLVMGLFHSGDRHVWDGHLRWISWPSGTSQVWPHRSQVQRVMCQTIRSIMTKSWEEWYISLFSSCKRYFFRYDTKWEVKRLKEDR